MIYPNKNIKFKESVLFKMLEILEYKVYGEIQLLKLYRLVEEDFDSIDQFLISLDVLYALNMIDLNNQEELITYVD